MNLKDGTTRKMKYLLVSPSVYIRMLTNSHLGDTVVNPLPPDARYVRSGIDSFNNIVLVVESEEFDEVGDGEEIPFYGKLLFKRANVGEKVN